MPKLPFMEESAIANAAIAGALSRYWLTEVIGIFAVGLGVTIAQWGSEPNSKE